MKYMQQIILFGIASLLLVACTGDQTEDKNAIDDNTQQTENNHLSQQNQSDHEMLEEAINEEDMRVMLEQLGLTKIEVEIDYADREFEVEIKQKEDGTIKAEVDDELNGLEIEQTLKAFNYIFPFIKDLNIEQATPKEEAIEKIVDHFGVPEDYIEFEAEFTFSDGTSIEYEDKR